MKYYSNLSNVEDLNILEIGGNRTVSSLYISILVFSCSMKISRPDGSIYSTTTTIDASKTKDCRKLEDKGKY